MANKNKSKEDFVERMNELAKKGTNLIKESTSALKNQTLLENTKAANGRIYGIVKENDKYFIKTSTSLKKEKLDESDFSYMGGIQNKLEYRYTSLTEAQRNLTYLLATVGSSFGIINEEEKIEDKTTETPAPEVSTEKSAPVASAEVSTPSPEASTTPEPSAEPTPAPTTSPEAATSTETPAEDDKSDANKEAIQHLVGKLMGELSDAQAKPGLTKWVVNSILGTVDLTTLKDSDKDKMIKKIKGELEEGENLDLSLNEEDVDDVTDSTISNITTPDSIIGLPNNTVTGNLGSQSVKIDLNNKTVDVNLNESKLRTIISKVINEQLTGVKPSVNESKLEKFVAKLVKESIETREKKKLNESTEAVNPDIIAADAKKFFSSGEITQIGDVMKTITEADENAEENFEEKLSATNPALYTKFLDFLKKYPGVQRAVIGTILAAKLMGMSTGAMAKGKDDILKDVKDTKAKVEKKIDGDSDKEIKVIKTDKSISVDLGKTFKSGDFKVDKHNTELYKAISDIAHFAIDHPDSKLEVTIDASESNVPNQNGMKPGSLAQHRAEEIQSYIHNIFTFNGLQFDDTNLTIKVNTGVNGPAWNPDNGDTKDDVKFTDNQFVKAGIKVVGEKSATNTGNNQELKKFRDMWQPVYEDGLKKFDNAKSTGKILKIGGKLALEGDDYGLLNILNHSSFSNLSVEDQQHLVDNYKQMFKPSDSFVKALSDGTVKINGVKPGIKF